MDIKYHLLHPYSTVRRIFDWMRYKFRFKTYYLSDHVKSIKSITPEYISLGRRCYIGYNGRIEGVSRYNNISYIPNIVIEDGVSIQQNIHLTCANSVRIGKNTAIAANVTITDIDHPYINIDIPIECQDLVVKSVSIGEDCKIYNGAVILQGVNIGKHCVVGANSVVSKSIPDYCVVVGAPARIVKRFDFELMIWRKTNPDGLFI